MHKSFNKAKRPKEFRKWLLRQYFNQDKNLNDPWFNFSVNEQNVLDYIANCENRFPLTPTQTVGMWNTIESFRKGYKATKKDFDDFVLLEDKRSTNTQLKEHTLEEIGQELGGITATMINRLAADAMNKFKTLTFCKHFQDMSPEEQKLHDQAITKYRTRAAEKYTKILKECGGDLNDIFSLLSSMHIMTEKEIELIAPEEHEAIVLLSSLEEEDIKAFLLEDIAHQQNIITSFQCMVSKEAFPAKKRGRPRKNA